MSRAHIRIAACGALLFLGVSMAVAQEPANLGELLDKGGKRLDAAELRALLTDATVSGMTLRPGSRIGFEVTYASDGKSSGRLWGLPVDAAPGTSGAWTIDEQGQFCTNTVTMAFGTTSACTYFYRLNDAYYAAASNERSAFVRTRTIKR